MEPIKIGDIVICINENDEHFLQNGKVEDIKYDSYYQVITYVDIRYANEKKSYKYLSMEYNFKIVKSKVLTID